MCVIHVLAVRGLDKMDGQQRYHAWISNGQTLHVHHLLGFKISTNLHWIRNTCFKVSVTFCYKGSSCYYYLHSPTATNIKEYYFSVLFFAFMDDAIQNSSQLRFYE